MNHGFFTGRAAKAPHYRNTGRTPVCYITLICNEYAGVAAGGEARQRQVAIPFTAFNTRATAIAENVDVGDQLVVSYRLANNDRPREAGAGDTDVEYGFSFIIEDFEFGAPGAVTRERLAKAVARA